MNKYPLSDQLSLFDDINEHKLQKEFILDHLSYSYQEKYTYRLFQFLSLEQMNIAEYEFFSSLIRQALEELKQGSLALFIKEDNSIKNYLYSADKIVDIFFMEEQKSFRQTQKLFVYVVSKQKGEGYLYFQKQWNTYLKLSDTIKDWVNQNLKQTEYKEEQLVSLLEKFSINLNIQQYQAVLKSLNHSFNIITGGPGTGKTTVASFILEGFLQIKSNANIVLLAPTGRASSRLQDSLEYNLQSQKTPSKALELFKAGRLKTQTIHSFLQKTKPLLREDKTLVNTLYLDIDLVIIDEVSMVSPALFYELIRWISPHTKVILLGDPYQLPSIEEGFLLGYFLAPDSYFYPYVYELNDLVRAKDSQDLTDLILYTQQQIKQGVNPISSHHQWNIPPMIQNLALNDLEALLVDQSKTGVYFLELEDEREQTIHNILDVYMKKYKNQSSKNNNIQDIFNTYYSSQILTPIKEGSMGIQKINEYCQLYLLNKLGQEDHYFLPILVQKNQEHLGLFNGDLGLLKHFNQTDIKEEVFFNSHQTTRSYIKEEVQAIDYCFGMTVHKSQGSEFQDILLFLPSYAINRVFSQEVFYTGISRAKKRVILIGQRKVLKEGLKFQYSRHNGLPL